MTIKDKDFEQMVVTEFKELQPNLVWQNDNGEYELFGKYKIVPAKSEYSVYYSDSFVGVFYSKKTAVSWCIADKFNNFNLAKSLLVLDTKLNLIKNDISVRIGIADRSKKAQFKEDISTKLEPKITYKKALEAELNKCVNWAKYRQQRGFINETARTGRATTNKTSR